MIGPRAMRSTATARTLPVQSSTPSHHFAASHRAALATAVRHGVARSTLRSTVIVGPRVFSKEVTVASR